MAGFAHVGLSRLVRRLLFLQGQDIHQVERWYAQDERGASGDRGPWTSYGAAVRKVAEGIGLPSRELSKYSEAEVRQITAEVARRVRAATADHSERAASNELYPYGWGRAMEGGR